MKEKSILISLSLFLLLPAMIKAQTDASLYFKKGNQEQIAFVESKNGNLFNKLGHHGPAIENDFFGLRLYFDKRTAIDVYSKSKPQLELKEKGWYPSKKEQADGWGADYYKVGKTIGLGGVRLWDGEKLIRLNPVTSRSASVESYTDSACMVMTSYGVPYLGEKVDVQIKVTVFSDRRLAKVVATSLNGKPLKFATGINYFNNLEQVIEDQFIATWGIHPEDVAAEKTEVGAAIIYQKNTFERVKKLKDQFILVSLPASSISYDIISVCSREKELNTFKKLIDFIEKHLPGE